MGGVMEPGMVINPDVSSSSGFLLISDKATRTTTDTRL